MNIKFKYTCNYYMKIIMRYMIFQLKRLNFNNNINAQFPVLVSIELHRNSVECCWNSTLISHWLQLTWQTGDRSAFCVLYLRTSLWCGGTWEQWLPQLLQGKQTPTPRNRRRRIHWNLFLVLVKSRRMIVEGCCLFLVSVSVKMIEECSLF